VLVLLNIANPLKLLVMFALPAVLEPRKPTNPLMLLVIVALWDHSDDYRKRRKGERWRPFAPPQRLEPCNDDRRDRCRPPRVDRVLLDNRKH
jgi:hypothetical protein